MLYFSIAITLIVLILAFKTPTITIHHKYEVIQAPTPIETDPGEPEKMDELLRNKPPNMEDVVTAINKTLFDIGGEDE